jgi:hypothetical protein
MSDDRDRGGDRTPFEHEERIDLSALDPRRDARRFEARMLGLRRAAAPELLRRSRGPSLWDQLRTWRGPVLAASGLFAAVCVAVLAVSGGSPSGRAQKTGTRSTTQHSASLAEALGVPAGWEKWLKTTTAPGPADLLEMEGSRR